MTGVFTLTLNTQGQDIQTGNPAAGDNLTGTAGTDIIAGLGGNDTLSGLAGDDFLSGDTGNDNLNGGDGDDLLLAGDDQYYNSSYIAFNFATSPSLAVTSLIDNALDRQFKIDEWFDILNIPQAVDPGTEVAITGGSGADAMVLNFAISATAINFTMQSGANFVLPNGVTQVSGVESAWVQGSTLNDTLTGGTADDRLQGFTGNDALDGGEGEDFLFGGFGQDALRGGGGDDFLASTVIYTEFLRAGSVVPLSYQTGLTPTIFSGGLVLDSDTILDGGTGDDTAVISFFGAAAVTYVLDPTQLAALPGIGTQISNVEAIWVVDSANAGDNISGGALDDRFASFDGLADTFDGRGGIDTYETVGTSRIDLSNNANNTGAAAGDTLTSIENVVGSFGADTLIGNSVANDLQGSGGADSLVGGEGDDTLGGSDIFGAPAGDTLVGGVGRDTVSYATSSPALGAPRLLVDLLNPGSNTGDALGDTYSEIENIVGSRRGDSLFGDNFAAGNRIDGGLGQDSVLGRGGADTVVASAGADTLDGGSETDLLILSGNRSDYAITNAPGGFLITDNRGASFDGTDLVTTFETFQFGNGEVRNQGNLINATPTAPTLSSSTVNENVAIGTVVGTLSSTDADVGDTLTFREFPDNANSSLFNVVGNQIVTAAAIDFETLSNQSITVEVSDGRGGTAQQTFNIAIQNVNEAPTAIQLSNTTIAENSAGEAVGALTATDIDTNAAGLTFSVLGADAALFEVDGATLRVQNGAVVDFEDDATKNITIRVSDGDNTFDQNFVIQITDVLEPIVGDGGDNRLEGGPDDDTISGLGGNDTLVGLGGGDDLDGGQGTDTAEYTKAVRLDLLDSDNNSGQAEGDTFTSIEKFKFSNGADNAAGSDGADDFEGNGGSDRLSGQDGDDKLDGGNGKDTLNGGEGADSLAGGTGNDRYVVDDAGDVVEEAAGGGSDTVRSSVDFTLSRNVEDLILTGSSAIDGTGNNGANRITGNSRANELAGKGGADELNGGGGNDTITGGAGNDTLDGGGGRDTFVFGRGFGRDVIENFQGGAGAGDVLRFDDALFANDAAVFAAAREVGDDVVIRFNAQNTVTLADTTLAQLNNNDFSFF